MRQLFDFAILFPDKTNQEILLLKAFFEAYDLKVAILPCQMNSLEEIINLKIKTVIVFNQEDSEFSQKFIIEASVRKIFYQSTFYHLSMTKPDKDNQMKLMTLGYAGFVSLPFSASDTQNNIDISDCLFKAA